MGREDIPRAWTRDSKSVVFDSNRDGNWKIFRQRLDGGPDEPLVESREDAFAPHVSPDGAWLLYLERSTNWKDPQPVRLMRVSLARGLPQLVLTTSAPSAYGLRFACPQRAGLPCWLAEQAGARVRFRPIDPLHGFTNGPEAVANASAIQWGISPDGSRLGWAERRAPATVIHVVSLVSSASSADVTLAGWSQLHTMHWAADGTHWFVVVRSPARWTLLEANSNGSTRVLLERASAFTPDVFPSPDGRRLALGIESATSNIWLLDQTAEKNHSR